MKRNLAAKLVLVIVMSLGLGTGQVSAERLTIDGSTTVGPIADAWAEVFQAMYPDLNITVQKTGSGNGIAALIDGRADVGMSSRFMRFSEFEEAIDKGVYPVAHVVAVDGVCIVLHRSNPVNNLSLDQVRRIYAGQITNWNEVGGPDMGIVVISRDTSSGTYGSFSDAVMGSDRMSGRVEYVNSNPQAHARVRSTRGAIGYVGVGFLDDQVKPIELEGVAPTSRNIATGRYPIARAQYMFTDGYPKLGSVVHEYVTFYLTELGHELVESAGFVPVTDY